MKLKVLMYVDWTYFKSDRDYGVDLLRGVLESDAPERIFGVTIETDLVFRGESTAEARFETSRLEDYDEVWLFLAVEQFAKQELLLTGSERAALRAWMDAGGGVLITGDHAETINGKSLGRGKAIGEMIPRAGELRRWDGPSRLGPDVIDTTVLRSPYAFPESKKLEDDDTPQRLLLPPYRGGAHHPIFYGERERYLDRFPDHPHEGEVRIPAKPSDEVWRLGASTPAAPRVIARGINRSMGSCYDVMAAWDGDASSAGRIIADSTWHHYINLNIRRLLCSKRDPTIADDLRRIFINQAIWLAPRKIRRKIAHHLLDRLAASVEVEPEDYAALREHPIVRQTSIPMLTDLLGTHCSSSAHGVIDEDPHCLVAYGLKELVSESQRVKADRRAAREGAPFNANAALKRGLQTHRAALERELEKYDKRIELL